MLFRHLIQKDDLTILENNILFERGARKFLSDHEKLKVKDTFQRDGRKTITIMDIRNEVAKNEAFKNMFDSIVNSNYNGSTVGRQKAEQAIKNSFRSQFRNVDGEASKTSSIDTNDHKTISTNDVIDCYEFNEFLTQDSVNYSSAQITTIRNDTTCHIEILRGKFKHSHWE